MRATGFLLVFLSAPSSWIPPCFCVEGATAAGVCTAFVNAGTTTSTSTRPRATARSRQQPPRPRAQQEPWPSRPAERGRSSVGGRVGLRAASTGGDEVVSVRKETPGAGIEEGDSSTEPAGLDTRSPHLGAYWDILRPQNIPPSFGLVAAGALVASHTVGTMLDPQVCCWAVGSTHTQNFPDSQNSTLLQAHLPGVLCTACRNAGRFALHTRLEETG